MLKIDVAARPVQKAGLSALLKENNIRLNEYAKAYMAHPKFAPEEPLERLSLTLCSLEELGLKNGDAFPDILAAAAKAGLKPCRPTAGLFLRLGYTGQPESENRVLTGTHSAPEGSVTVLSEPLEQDHGFPKGLYLRNVGGELWLRGYICDDQYIWSPKDLFAFEKGAL